MLLVAGERDHLATSLLAGLSNRRISSSLLDGLSAARKFTIKREGSTVFIEPDCAIFLRQSAWDNALVVQDSDERFLRAEAFATVWAAATLTQATVINRPVLTGINRIFRTDILAALEPSALDKSEIHASGPEVLVDIEGLWGENVESTVGPVEFMPGGIPLRARNVCATARYEVMTVVGQRAFSSTLDPRVAEFKLEEQSISLAQKFKLHFTTVTWSIEGIDAYPIRINSAPQSVELRHNWNQVIESLCDDLVL